MFRGKREFCRKFVAQIHASSTIDVQHVFRASRGKGRWELVCVSFFCGHIVLPAVVDDVGINHSIVHPCLLPQLMFLTRKELRSVDALLCGGDEVQFFS